MTVNEPGALGRRQMTISHPLAADWPRWLRSWWGLVQPPDLLLRIGAFPTLTRLPSPSLFPALALEVVSRIHSFLGASLPFLDTGAPVLSEPSTPRFDYRMRRPRLQTATGAHLAANAHPTAEPVHTMAQADNAQAIEQASAQQEPGAATQDPVMLAEDAHAGEEPVHETRVEPSLTPFQESEWEPLPELEHAPTLGESIQHVEEWREAWNASEAPEPAVRPLGVLQSPLGGHLTLPVTSPLHARGATGSAVTGNVPEPLAHSLATAAPEFSVPLSQGETSPGATQVTSAVHDLNAQGLSGPAQIPARLNPELRIPSIPARRLSAESSQSRDLNPEEALAGTEPPQVEATHLPAGQSETGALGPAHSFSATSLREPMPGVSPMVTAGSGPLVGEVIHRQERAVDSLSLIGRSPATVEPLELHTTAAQTEHVSTTAQPQPGERVQVSPAEAELLHHNAQAAQTTLHTSLAGEPSPAVAHEDVSAPLANEVLPTPAHVESERVAEQPVFLPALMVDRLSASSATPASQPRLELRHPLPTIAPRMTLNSVTQAHPTAAMGEELGIASIAMLPGLVVRREFTDLAERVNEAGESHVAVTEHEESTAVAASQSAMTPRTTGQAPVSTAGALARTPAGSPPLRHELTVAEHPLALRPLPEVSHLLSPEHEAEHAVQLPEQPLDLGLPHEAQSAPSMEVRRESHAASTVTQARNVADASASQPWTNESASPAIEQRAAQPAQPAALAVPETEAGGGDSGGVWQGGATAPAAAPGGTLDVESIARQVLSMLQSQLRAERDRHQLYDR